MSNYDDWKTAAPPEGRRLRVELKVVLVMVVSNDPDLSLDREAVKAVSAIEGVRIDGLDEIDAHVVEREFVP